MQQVQNSENPLTTRANGLRCCYSYLKCSHFSSVGSLIKEEIDNKKVAFIPTASLREGYTGYVGSARKLFNKLGATVTEIDISTEAYLTIQSVFEDADVIYFTGGNSFFLMDQLRKTGTDELLKKELEKGKLMIGESAGAIICAPTIQYIEQMDEKPEDYSQEDDAGLDLIDFYVLPHYLTAPFKKVTEKIMTEFEAFEYLFKSFTDDNLPTTNNYHGYRLIACDGSNLTIATNQKDPETFWERNQHGSIVNKLHLNAFYDVLNRIYTDVLVQTAADYNEFRACATMIDRSKLENVILVADRGYENYNIFAHAIEKGWKFAIRVKDKNSNGIASGLNLPPNDEFDIDITQIFRGKIQRPQKNAGYKWMPVNQVFDYLPRKK